LENGNNSHSPGALSSNSKNSRSPQPISKALYIFSNIFERSEDIKNCPFVFEKHSLKKRKTDEEYGDIKMSSMLIRPKK
jgi:hypothetical protein